MSSNLNRMDVESRQKHEQLEYNRFECPVYLSPISNAVITRCGHTFNSDELTACLAHHRICPLDRCVVKEGDIRPNHIVNTAMGHLTKIFKEKENLIKVFLCVKSVRTLTQFNEEYRCLLSNQPFTEPVTLPCRHSYNHSALVAWHRLHNFQSFRCPLDGEDFDLSRLNVNESLRKESSVAYKEWQERIQVFNRRLLKRFRN